jgi:hypothetical protein
VSGGALHGIAQPATHGRHHLSAAARRVLRAPGEGGKCCVCLWGYALYCRQAGAAAGWHPRLRGHRRRAMGADKQLHDTRREEGIRSTHPRR